MLANRLTRKMYSNLVFNADTKVLADRETNTQLPLSGLYSLELFNEFNPTIVFTIEKEDWHHKDLDLSTYTAALYKLEERRQQALNQTDS
jgi:hypothetical protein